MSFFEQTLGFIRTFLATGLSDLGAILWQLPLFVLLELPLLLVVFSGVALWNYRRKPLQLNSNPNVSCILTCYSEGEAVRSTILSICEQLYPGNIEIFVVVDGASQNDETYQAALNCLSLAKRYPTRQLTILPKWQRGGRVSSLNAALNLAKGDLIFSLDGDTSFDNDMVAHVVKEFEDPNVPAVAGALRLRNAALNPVTRFQAIEYIISIQCAKTGMSAWTLINGISGAFGAFRKDFIKQLGGWDTHSGEDLDITLRIKQYAKRHPKLRIPFATLAIGHTDGPTTWKQLFNQRLRWDGDLIFLYLRKHRAALSPKLLGWKFFIFNLVYGVLQNAVMPLVVILYNLFLLVFYPPSYVLASLTLIYLFYSALTLLYFVLFLVGVSERPKQDLSMLPWLPFYPIYGLTVRFFTTVAVINEVLRRGHEESNMAPWWVLKRGKKF